MHACTPWRRTCYTATMIPTARHIDLCLARLGTVTLRRLDDISEDMED